MQFLGNVTPLHSPQKPIDNNENDDYTEAAAAEFFSRVAGDKGFEKSVHNVGFKIYIGIPSFL